MVKVLVVDDEPNVTSACVNVLKAKNYDCCGALNSTEAFKALETFKPDIILLDINLMEKITGVDILKKALELNPNVQTAVITGLGDGTLVDEALSLGAKTVMQKPTGLAKILETINELAKNIKE